MDRIQFGLLGAGGFAREVMPFVKQSVARSLSVTEDFIDVYFVETWQPQQTQVNGYPAVSLQTFGNLPGKKYFNVAVGNGEAREAMVAAVGTKANVLALQSGQTIFLDNNSISEGSVFCANTMVTSNVKIGKFFQCNIYSYVAHDCVIGDYVTFAPGVRCNGRVHIEDHVYIGTNAIIREGTADQPMHIGKGAVIGMGSVVTKNVLAGTTVTGNPARLFEKR